MNDVSPQVTAVVLAGGDPNDRLARQAGVDSKAMVPIGDRPMVSYVVEALQNSSAVSQLVYVGPGAERLDSGRLHAVPAGKGYADSLALGMGAALALDPCAPILVVTADVPWLSAEAVDRFIQAVGSADLGYPVVPEQDAIAAFPSQRRTFARLKQGRFTGGNLMLLRPNLVGSLLDLIDNVYRTRKNPFALAAIVGPGTLLSLLLGRADLCRLERLASLRLGGVARVVVSKDACLAADVDRPDQLAEFSRRGESP